MIYPPQFPVSNDNEYEREVYIALSKLMNPSNPELEDFDVFCFRKFSGTLKGEKIEYEIDFIVADKRNRKLNGIAVIETKGHTLRYNGLTSTWTQDGKQMKETPVEQATTNMRSLLKRFDFMQKDVPFGWAVWFPRMVNPGQNHLPTELSEVQYFDEISLTYTKEKLHAFFDDLYAKWSYKRGLDLNKYNFQFVEPLIRSLGFAIPLHKQIEAAEVRFLEMTNRQMELLDYVTDNKSVMVKGPAGSGKTIMATTIAREKAEQGERTVILTFNRILANNIRYGLGRPENPEVSTYHGLARNFIDEVDNTWWDANKRNDNFWDMDIPVKLEEVRQGKEPVFDTIVIDEAQDHKELWFDSLKCLMKPDANLFIFMDEDQDIFKHFEQLPMEPRPYVFPLKENCRNTVAIINQLKGYIKKEIPYKPDAVEGAPVRIIEYKSDTDQMNLIKKEWLNLVENENLSPDRILLMMNADKKSSCIGKTKSFGKYKVESLSGRTGQLDKRRVNYSSIRSFKGLEVDVVFIIDTDKVENPDYRVLYTQASRAKHLLYIFKSNKN